MPPSNTTFATATLIPSLPYDFTQTDINDGGVNYTVYYKFIAPANSRVIGAWGFSGNIGAGYRPTIRPYLGPAGAPTQILGIASINKPIQFPVTPGLEYFLEFQYVESTPGPEDLRVRVEVAPLNPISRGNIVVNDDAAGFPLCVLSQNTDHTVINFVKDIADGEAGDILRVGPMAIEIGTTIRLYDLTFATIATTSYSPGTIRIRGCRTKNKFYCGLSDNPNPVVVNTLSTTGVLGPTHTLTGNTSLESLAAKNDETILYHAAVGSGVPVKRWDLISDVQLSDLAPLIADYKIPDILYLEDDTILALYFNSTTKDVIVKRYSTAGAVLNTYSLGAQVSITKPRLAFALDSPNSFWVWTHTADTSIFRNVAISSGAVLTTRNQTEYEGGQMVANETATPNSRFGNSFSCPFFIMVDPLSGIYFINPDKATKHDSYYSDVEKKIPNPTVRTALVGE